MTHIMRINEEEFVEKLNITPMSKERLGSGNVPSQYYIMLWCYPSEFKNESVFKNVDGDTLDILDSDGYNMTVEEFIGKLKEFSKKTGLHIEINTPSENAECGLCVNGCGVGSFIITSIKDNPKILRMAVGDEDKDYIQIN